MQDAARPSVDELPKRPELVDPLESKDGDRIQTWNRWTSKRREVLRDTFRYYVYGYAPPAPTLTIEGTRTASVIDGHATLREVDLRYQEHPTAPTLRLAVFLPANREGAVPVFLAANGCGSHTLVADEAVTITDGWRSEFCPPATDEARGAFADAWEIQAVNDRGYGLATFHVSDVEPDTPDVDGVREAIDVDVSDNTAWGCIAAWAWGYQRGIDYLVDADGVSGDNLAVIGHSRLGKAALLAGATDERIGLTVPHQSGTAGMALFRDNDQETLADIAEAFPHWFNEVFQDFAGREERLPVDQHVLASLVAPRHLLDTAGEQDVRTSPDSVLRTLRNATDVYELAGVEGLGANEVLREEPIEPDRVGRLLQYRCDTDHEPYARYWDAILDYADIAFERASEES